MIQSLCVKWGSQLSREFNDTNGVKHGWILSPVLFTVYIDELLLVVLVVIFVTHF